MSINRTMIMLDEGRARFVFRIVGVALHDNHVLLHRAEQDNFWSLPGGRAELLEPSKETLKREMQEELGVSVTVERLLWIVENFFEHSEEHLERSFYELGLYFLMTLPQNSPVYSQQKSFPGREDELKLIFQWFPLAELKNLILYPEFLRTALQAIPQVTEHVVNVS